MTKFDALKMLPVERFAELFYDMAHKANSSEVFKKMLLEEIPEDVIPALQKCSTGKDLVTRCPAQKDSSSNRLDLSDRP